VLLGGCFKWMNCDSLAQPCTWALAFDGLPHQLLPATPSNAAPSGYSHSLTTSLAAPRCWLPPAAGQPRWSATRSCGAPAGAPCGWPTRGLGASRSLTARPVRYVRPCVQRAEKVLRRQGHYTLSAVCLLAMQCMACVAGVRSGA
jgi:hypothetical protein